MRHNHEHFVAFAIVDHAAIAIQRAGGKAHFTREVEGIGQGVMDMPTQRHAFFRLTLGNARKRDELAKRGKLFVKVLVNELFIHQDCLHSMRLLARIRSIYHTDRAGKKQAARLHSGMFWIDFYARG
ncbi:hypothetical protein SDC9_143130 [bioreactor metagenome]|uniref:Uncharacterized protein n=1 Tax=bioreactor metagenome TaxID=1076179 RepID=A0A645E2F4_9ZZZZ